MSVYSVPPFSGPQYDYNAKRAGKLLPCAICGRGVNTPWPHSAIVIDGGAHWGDETSPEDAGHMGSWPVGADCHRKYLMRHYPVPPTRAERKLPPLPPDVTVCGIRTNEEPSLVFTWIRRNVNCSDCRTLLPFVHS